MFCYFVKKIIPSSVFSFLLVIYLCNNAFGNDNLYSIYYLGFRSELCDPKPSPLSYLKNEHICGRPLGLRFDKKTGDLYIADAYFGLLKVGPEGGLATSLTTEAEGVPLRFTNDLDIDEEGNIYFTDSSTKYQRR